jgi:hypothetical protein
MEKTMYCSNDLYFELRAHRQAGTVPLLTAPAVLGGETGVRVGNLCA